MLSNTSRSPAPFNQFVAGGGEIGNLIRSVQWTETPMGNVSFWPLSLRTAISIMLAAPSPMCVVWGKEYIQFYNDSYRPILVSANKKEAIGISARETFKESWGKVEKVFHEVRGS